MLFASPKNERNIPAVSIPQNIKNLLCHLSAINPKNGCDKEEVRFDIDINIAAIVIDIPICAAINGIIGFKNPEYASVIK